MTSHPVIQESSSLTLVVCGRCELISARRQWSTFYLAQIGNHEANQWLSSLVSREWVFHYKPTAVEVKEASIVFDKEEEDPIGITGTVDIQASPDAFVPLLKITELFQFKLEWGDCAECRGRVSGQYAGKIQIRTYQKLEPQKILEWDDELTALSQKHPLADRKNPLFRINILKNGIDALFRSRSPAAAVAREFARNRGGILSTTTEFAGFDKMKSREYPRKHVVLVDLPPFNIEDIVIYNGNPVQILGFRDFKVDYWDFRKNNRHRIPVKQFREASPQRLDQEFTRFQVVYFEQDQKIAQIMETTSFETQYVETRFLPDLSEGDTFFGIWISGFLLVKRPETK